MNLAILHGGPCDREQVVVREFLPEMLRRWVRPLDLRQFENAKGAIGDDFERPIDYIYELAGAPYNPMSRWRATRPMGVPIQTVALYVFIGERR